MPHGAQLPLVRGAIMPVDARHYGAIARRPPFAAAAAVSLMMPHCHVSLCRHSCFTDFRLRCRYRLRIAITTTASLILSLPRCHPPIRRLQMGTDLPIALPAHAAAKRTTPDTVCPSTISSSVPNHPTCPPMLIDVRTPTIHEMRRVQRRAAQ